ncbi:transglycosylase domain-containing protein [Gracilibacillus salinarum]|uniref:PBP1A family penicillin-binding protein n=1 Tax=Gracilibacillus salinarum TaxID=2932255 RepID=A0ABY4GNS7_9BACI|nr:PBP1A family penicillin-binding protein [Gracilibacillus salinarum]UOQ85848.1 PBP1A family penicillin-binding protein [Gracilibacillus salinarum]
MADNSQSRMERRKQGKQKKTNNNSTWKKIMKYALIAVLLIGLGVGALFTYYVATAPDIDAELLSDPASTNLLDVNGDVFAKLGSEKRTKISYDDIPQQLEDAILATEDVRFFSHIGIDFRRIGAAVIANFKNGFGSQGASTITQQVVKGSFLTNDKKLKRKVQEQWLALKLDSQYSKEEILEMYVNKIYYGSSAYGVATAAEVYFGKTDLSELTLAESAILAGLPQRPSAYDPFVNPELTKERMNTVLNLMVQHNKISEQEAEEARNVNIEELLTDKKKDYVKYEGFIQQVRKEVQEKTGADIYKDGLTVHTTLDPNAQEQVELLLSDSEDNPIPFSKDPELQAGLSVVDTKTGAIRAIGGGRNRENDGWNYAIDGDGRQGGSVMKPVMAYGPAIENLQWSTYQQLNNDQPYPIEGTDKVIRNWNGSYNGWVSARYALEQSLNVPAVKTFAEVGTSAAKEFAEGLGLTFQNNLTITDAIGGTANGVTSLQMAGAYSAFGNEGIYHEPYAVKKIEYSDDRSEELVSEAQVAMADSTAYMVTDMLKSVVQEGTGTAANISGLDMAGKTGTTNDDTNSWFVGYTTNYTVSVWTGYPNPAEIQETGIAKQLFKETMSYISEGVETKDFTKPDSVVEVQIEKGSNPAKLPSDYTPNSNITTELFVKGTEPSSVSEKFDKLDPVANLSANYDKENDTITANWEYDEDDVQFKVSAGTDGSLNDLTTTEDKEVEISNVEKGKTYTIEVIAANDDMESEPQTVTVEVADDQPEELPQVSGLQQTYDPANRSALISWQYDQQGPIEYEVVVEQGGQTVDQFTTNKKSVNISQLQADKTYNIHVSPIQTENDARGPAASIQVTTQSAEPEDGGETGDTGNGNDNGQGNNNDGDSEGGNTDGEGDNPDTGEDNNNENQTDDENNEDSGSEEEPTQEQQQAS